MQEVISKLPPVAGDQNLVENLFIVDGPIDDIALLQYFVVGLNIEINVQQKFTFTAIIKAYAGAF